ncbi:MAG: hypothetical protein HYY50_00520 [Candidatus Kerfeldbacteria bacterium]|nr:hypothetical protein [Candidatus Kerfeldbacteria bacterium]
MRCLVVIQGRTGDVSAVCAKEPIQPEDLALDERAGEQIVGSFKLNLRADEERALDVLEQIGQEADSFGEGLADLMARCFELGRLYAALHNSPPLLEAWKKRKLHGF